MKVTIRIDVFAKNGVDVRKRGINVTFTGRGMIFRALDADAFCFVARNSALEVKTP